MSDERLVREKVRRMLDSGRAPPRFPDNVWGRPGSNGQCAICETPIPRHETELEIEFLDGPSARSTSFVIHARCFSMLEIERHNNPEADV